MYLTLNTISLPKVVTQLPKPNKDLSPGQLAMEAGDAGGRCSGGSVLPAMVQAVRRRGAAVRGGEGDRGVDLAVGGLVAAGHGARLGSAMAAVAALCANEHKRARRE
jgi:hypothetical protein